ncbi:DUF4160 domain-containing protein [Bifidobacterium vespertilionis]|uniref:DUF4160 domain-containing protein n=1 Tax=Bifidobacterium vespertilionis TaxID=2562524 RepID=UPI0023E76CD6|nr:DUF4160 domain-containing protein [Bifidobacterium vespertilionis]
MFFGIIITMNYNDHPKPHIHAKYGEFEAAYLFDGTLDEGELPRKQERLVVAWIELHQDELKANWEIAQAGEPVFRIEPLR